MKRMQCSILIASIMAVSGYSTVASARGHEHEENHNFLHGKPFATINHKIEINSEAINSINADISNIQTQFDTLWLRIDANAVAIGDALGEIQSLKDGMNLLSGDLDSLTGELYGLKLQYETDLASIRQQLNELSQQVANLGVPLSGLAKELATKVAALESAITTRSEGVRLLKTEVTILSAHVTLMQTEVTVMLSRINLAEQALAQQQTDLGILGSLLAELSAPSGPDVQEQTADEFFFQDTTDDDQQGEELADFFRALNATADSYIYVEGIASNSGAWCSANAAWYVDSYLENYNGPGITLPSGTWQKWSTTLDGNWTETTATFRNIYSYQCIGSSGGWCTEWGIGGQNIAYLPNMPGSSTEVINGNSAGSGSLRIKVGSSRADACGF